MTTLGRGHEVDVEDLVATFMQIADDDAPGLFTASSHGDLRHALRFTDLARAFVAGSD